MHFEILIEDRSGQKALEMLVPRILGSQHSFRIHSYRGIGRIPKNLRGVKDPKKRFLLTQLPKLLRGYGKTFTSYPGGYHAAVIVVTDLDRRCLKKYRKELCDVLQACNPRPEAKFCIAIEEGEAWLLGDLPAVKLAYPNAKDQVLNSYTNDSICGTWEKLADAIHQGGADGLSAQGYQAIGKAKFDWATKITPHMDVENNQSESFCYFRNKVRSLAGTS
jgi:hypothetical protein